MLDSRKPVTWGFARARRWRWRESNPQPSDPEEDAAVPASRSCPPGIQHEDRKHHLRPLGLVPLGRSCRSQSCAARYKSRYKFSATRMPEVSLAWTRTRPALRQMFRFGDASSWRGQGEQTELPGAWSTSGPGIGVVEVANNFWS